MASTTQKFVLVGPHAGKTMQVNGHQFEDGEFTFAGSEEQVSVLARVFRRYGALPEQVARLKALEDAMGISKPSGDGDGDVKEPAAPSEPSPPVVGSNTNVGGGDLDPAKPTLAEAIGLLDPEVDAHWTSNNLPSLEHLGELTGKKVGRDDVNAVAEGYTRAKARAARQQ